MPTREETAYFGAGPAPLPTPVIEASARAFVNFNDTGLGLAELSHRSPTANKIIADAKEALIHLYDIPTEEYEIIFMQAGGTGEFSATVQNLVSAWVERRRQAAIKDFGEGKDQEVVDRVRSEIENELKVDYLVTGSWSLKASQEAARLIGAKYVNVAVDGRKFSKTGKFTEIPDEKDWKLSDAKRGAFTYFCDNETVDGVEFQQFPKSLQNGDRIVVADMSSNFLSRKINVKDYGVIFIRRKTRSKPPDKENGTDMYNLFSLGQKGGAQKNLGIAGITVTIIRKDLLSQVPPPTFLHQLSSVLPNAVPPIMFNFATIAANNSLYNTLPVFNLYVATLVLQSLVSSFGTQKVSGQEEVAVRKAKLIYDTLDAYPETFHVVPDKSIRSRMNVCFRILPKVAGGAGTGTGSSASTPDEAREKEFLAGAEKKNLMGLKGHRSVGGIRASNYNAVPEENVRRLVDYLDEFAKA